MCVCGPTSSALLTPRGMLIHHTLQDARGCLLDAIRKSSKGGLKSSKDRLAALEEDETKPGGDSGGGGGDIMGALAARLSVSHGPPTLRCHLGRAGWSSGLRVHRAPCLL